MNISIHPNYADLSRLAAARIAQIVREKPEAVLGLATGSTPLGIYRELIRLHREENLDFSRVTTFNLDEYFPIHPSAPQSYYRFMRENLFDHLNLAPQNCFIPRGEARSLSQVEADCTAYEAEIAARGGLDVQLLGIGRTGHIGFNEPGSSQQSRTRLVTLDFLTRTDAAADFFGIENVPVRAITMGIATILEAREILFLASGAGKAPIVAQALEGKITSKVPASFARDHPKLTIFLDEAAASHLTERAKPWSAPDANRSSFELQRRALISIALECGKPLAQLTTEDLTAAGAISLFSADFEARTFDDSTSIPQKMKQMENDTDDFASIPQKMKRAESETESNAQNLQKMKQAVVADFGNRLSDENWPRQQSVLCLSPHPDDDVICCGATLFKLAARGNQTFVAFGVSGANAVRDKDVLSLLRARNSRLISFLQGNLETGNSLEDAINQVRASIYERENGAPDAPLLRELKRLVREGEARDACQKTGATPLFWNLPFYNQNRDVDNEDVQIALETLRQVRPDFVLLTGEFNDPHGTHEKCALAFERAATIYRGEGGPSSERWNYRGAWDEWPVWAGDVFCVFDKEVMGQKIGAILDHISQLDPLFPGARDPREFFERARDRNRDTARNLQKLGLLPPTRSFSPIYAEVFRRQS